MSQRTAKLVALGIVICLLLAGIVSFYASSSPDGLEKVASDQGFLDTANSHQLQDGPLAGYAVRGVGDARLSGGLAGAAGVVLTLALAGGLFVALGRHRKAAGTIDDELRGDVEAEAGS